MRLRFIARCPFFGVSVFFLTCMKFGEVRNYLLVISCAIVHKFAYLRKLVFAHMLL